MSLDITKELYAFIDSLQKDRSTVEPQKKSTSLQRLQESRALAQQNSLSRFNKAAPTPPPQPNPPWVAPTVAQIETKIDSLCAQIQTVFDRAKSKHRLDNPTAAPLSRSEDVLNFEERYFLNQFKKIIKCSNSDVFSDQSHFANRSIGLFLSHRHPRLKKNLWESLIALGDPSINSYLVKNHAHIVLDSANLSGDMYMLAYKAKNHDLIDQLVAAQIKPTQNHHHPHVIERSLQDNNVAVFKKLEVFWNDPAYPFENLLNHCFIHNSINIFDYLRTHNDDKISLFCNSWKNPLKLTGNDEIDAPRPLFLSLCSHQNAYILNTLLEDKKLHFEISMTPQFESIKIFIKNYMKCSHLSYLIDHDAPLHAKRFQNLLDVFDLSHLTTRSVVVHGVHDYIESHITAENRDIFVSHAITLINDLNLTSTSTNLIDTTSQIVRSDVYMLENFYCNVATIFLKGVNFTTHGAEFFINPQLQFDYPARRYQNEIEKLRASSASQLAVGGMVKKENDDHYALALSDLTPNHYRFFEELKSQNYLLTTRVPPASIRQGGTQQSKSRVFIFNILRDLQPLDEYFAQLSTPSDFINHVILNKQSKPHELLQNHQAILSIYEKQALQNMVAIPQTTQIEKKFKI